MARLVILGSAAAVSDAAHDYTHFLLMGQSSNLLIDAGSNPLGKLQTLGVDEDTVQDMILTHFHPDHVAGLPNMLMHMWLLGRRKPLRFYALHHCVNRVEDMMLAYSWDSWPDFFPVSFHRVTERPCAPVFDNDDFHIEAWPTLHFVPTIGLRITNKRTGQVLAYTCDTQPIPTLADLGREADILIHESAGEGFGHSSAKQAGETATQSGAKSLALIHYQVWKTDPTPLIGQAQETFSGPVTLLKDFDELEF